MPLYNPIIGSLGTSVEISEIETLADGTIIVGDGSGAPTTLAAFSSATGTLKPANGGTGVANNAASTLTISGNFATTLTVSGATGVTLPTTGTLSTLAGAETLSGKTLTAPKIVTTGSIVDAGGDEYVVFTEATTPITYVGIVSGDTGVAPALRGQGETNTDLLLAGTGTGDVKIGDGADITKLLKIELVGATTAKTMTIASSQTVDRTLTLPDATDTLVGKATTDTFTNKTLTAAKIATGGFLADGNGNELIIFTTTASAVNEITFANGSTTVNPSFTASGETNVGIDFQAKGTGAYRLLGTVDQAAELRLYEDTTDGTNFTAFKVGTQSADITYTLPTDDGDASQVLSTNGSGVLDWITPGGGDLTVTKFAADALLTVAVTAINAPSTGASAIQFTDALTCTAHFMVKVPSGATSISAINVMSADESTGVLRLSFTTSMQTAAGYIQTDSSAEASYTPAYDDGRLERIVVPAAGYNGLTVSADRVMGVTITRVGGSGSDTYNANWICYGVEVVFA